MRTLIRASAFLLLFCLGSFAQDQANPAIPIYRITVVGRTVKAISYRTLSGSTKIAFRGTSLMPKAHGSAKVTSRRSATEIQAQFKSMESPSAFGPEYLTYVLWAITPDGRAMNIAEIPPDGGSASVDVTVNLQVFGMIVTAEPYFAVTRPSDVVVMENEVTNNTTGKIEEINAKTQLLKRGMYTQNVSPNEVQPVPMSSNVPLALYEAENAVRIARWEGAEQFAGETFDKAQQLLHQAQAYQARKAGKKPVIMTAREAVQTAEDARTIGIRRARQEQQAQERQAAAQQAAAAKAKAQEQSAASAQAQAAQAAAEASRQRAQAEAERAQMQAQQSQQQAQEASERAREADQQKAAMRAKLQRQLNSILQTRQTPRGLVVTMSHVFFESGQAALHPQTRETLAKLAGLLLAYPGINVQVDGYTDNTGSEVANQQLSQKRADTVRDFLVQQGLPASSVSSHGLGESDPVAPNDTATGRAMNRRVEIVISGGILGEPSNSTGDPAAQNPQ